MQPQTAMNATQKTKRPKAFKITLVVAAVLWLIACALVAYQDAIGSWSTSGLACFLVGALALLDGQVAGFVAWVSNVLVFIAVILLLTHRYQRAVIFSAIAFVCSFGAFFVTDFPKNEGTSETVHVAVGPAVFVWIASILTILIGSIVLNRATKKNMQSKN